MEYLFSLCQTKILDENIPRIYLKLHETSKQKKSLKLILIILQILQVEIKVKYRNKI